VGPFDELFTKKIRIYLVDQNNNIGYKDVDFEVYAPVPNISKIPASYKLLSMNFSQLAPYLNKEEDA
jgi:hypothetical protein